MNHIMKNRLKNNIQTIACQNINLHSINIGFYFKTGVIYETAIKNGISHLCEHLFFRRLNLNKQSELYYEMESIGTTMRAKTYSDFICFDMTVTPKYFVKALNIISQLLNDTEWCDEDLLKEKAVVKRQIEFNSSTFGDFVNENYFAGTKFKMPIMGTIDSVDKITLHDVNCWKNRFFTTDNLCVILTGAFSNHDYENFLAILEKIKKPGIEQKMPTEIIPNGFGKRNVKSDIIVNTDWEISDISFVFDVDTNFINPYSADILCSILGEGVGSRLSLLLREREALTDEICARVDTFQSIKRISVEFSVFNGDLENALGLACQEIVNLCQTLSMEDLTSAIIFFTDNQRIVLDSPRDYNFYLGWNSFVLNNEKNIEETIAQYKNIELKELHENATKIFNSKNSLVILTNNKQYCKNANLKKILANFRNGLDKKW